MPKLALIKEDGLQIGNGTAPSLEVTQLSMKWNWDSIRAQTKGGASYDYKAT